jgi:hypothetical protein
MSTPRYFVATRLSGELRPVDHWLYASFAEADERAAFDRDNRVVLANDTDLGAEVFGRRTRERTGG